MRGASLVAMTETVPLYVVLASNMDAIRSLGE
jgi:hypothetical protein